MHPIHRAYPNIPEDFPLEDFLDGLRQRPADVSLFVLNVVIGEYRRQLALVRDELELRKDQAAYLIAKLLASLGREGGTSREALGAARAFEQEALDYAITQRISYLESSLHSSC